MIYWITGNYYDTNKKIFELVTPEYNLISIECGYNSQSNKIHKDANDVISVLRTKDLFDNRKRIIKLLGIPSDYTELTKAFKYCNESNILLILSPVGFYKPAGSSSQFVSAAASNFYKEIKQTYSFLEFPEEAKNDIEAIKWLTKVAEDLEINISTELIKLIVDSSGKNLDFLYSQINKFHDLNREITANDIYTYCIPQLTKEVWDLITYMSDGNFDSSAVYLQKFFEDNITDSDLRSSLELTIGALRQHFELLLHAKDGCKKNDSLNYHGFANAIDGIKKISKDDKSADKFNKYIVNMKIKDPSFIKSFVWKKSRIYKIVNFIDQIRNKLRFGKNLYLIKIYLYLLSMYITNKVEEKDIAVILD